MKIMIRRILIIALIFGFHATAHAGAPEWKVDQAHSGIYFGIDHIFSKVQGRFKDFDGEIHFDPNNLAESRVAFSVKVKSIDTFNNKRDGHLQSDDFFSAKKYPEMRFNSDAISHKNGSDYVMDGTMTVKDVSRKIKIPFTFFGTKPNPFNPKQEVAGFEARMTVDRFDYNVGGGKFLKMGVVGKEADVLITIEAVRDK